MKIITWNVNGIRAVAKKCLLEFIEKEQPDILCVQESKAHLEQVEPKYVEPKGYKSYWSSAKRKGYSGTITYVKVEPANIDRGIGIEKYDDEGRFVVTDHGKFLLYNVYFPNGGSGQERHDFKPRIPPQFIKRERAILAAAPRHDHRRRLRLVRAHSLGSMIAHQSNREPDHDGAARCIVS